MVESPEGPVAEEGGGEATSPHCLKCKLFQHCNSPYLGTKTVHFVDGDAIDGPPADPENFVLVIGAPPDPYADKEGSITASDDCNLYQAALDHLGYSRWWYVPSLGCRAAETSRRKEGRLTKTEITRCWAKVVKPSLETHLAGRTPLATLLAGPIPNFAVLGTMESLSVEGQWRNTPYGLGFPMRGSDALFLNEEEFKAPFIANLKGALNYAEKARTAKDDGRSHLDEVKFTVARTEEAVRAWFEAITPDQLQEAPISWDTETNSLHLWKVGKFRICLWSFDHPSRPEVLLIPTSSYVADPLVDLEEEGKIEKYLRGIMENPKVPKIGHNLQFDENGVFSHYGWTVKGFKADTLILDFLLNSEEKSHALDTICCRLLPDAPRYWEDLEIWKTEWTNAGNELAGYSQVPPEILYPYAAWDTRAVSQCYEILLMEISTRKDWGGWFVRAGVGDDPVTPTLSARDYALFGRKVFHQLCTHMERSGTGVDLELLAMIGRQYRTERDELAEKLRTDPDVIRFEKEVLPHIISHSNAAFKAWKRYGTPMTISWGSVPQQQAFFINFLKLPILSRTGTGAPSLEESVISTYAVTNQAAKLLLGWRAASKFVTSFVEPLEAKGEDQIIYPVEGAGGKIGKIHPMYKSAGTTTGRLACGGGGKNRRKGMPRGYPMQAIPRDGLIKKLFRSTHPDGWFITRDYSGIEVRIMALLSRDETLLNAFRTGGDPHFITQKFFFNDQADAKNKTQRSICKRALFGRLYGQGDQGLFDLLSGEGVINPHTGQIVTLDECAEFNQLIDALYPGVATWVRIVHEAGLTMQWVASTFGFIRPLPGAVHRERVESMRRQYTYEVLKSNSNYRRLSAMVAEAQRHAQNSGIQGSAAELTVMAGLAVQRRYETEGLSASVVDVIHDDIWTDCPKTEEVEDVIGVLRDGMDQPQDWLPFMLPGYDPSWIDIPIIGECDLGISAKDCYPVVSEPTFGSFMEPGERQGGVKIKMPIKDADGMDGVEADVKDPEKVIVPFKGNEHRIRMACELKRAAI